MTDLSFAAQVVLNAIHLAHDDNRDSYRAAGAGRRRAAAIYCTRERRLLMAIADELEGVTYGTYRCELLAIADEPEGL